MKNFALALLLALGSFSPQSYSEIYKTRSLTAPAAKNDLPYPRGRLLLRLVDEASINDISSLLDPIDGIITANFPLVPNLVLIEYNPALNLDVVVDELEKNPLVMYAEPDYYFHAATLDARFNELWAMENTGQTGGLIDADINANSMWALTPGNQNVVIGVIDSGTDYNHPDLTLNLWRNVLDLPGTGIDEDGNGYVDDFYGINAITNNGNPFDDNAHGTHVAGTIGAKGNNVIGVVGVAQNVQIASCKFLNANGSGSTSDAIQCLQYFANLKTRAVNPVNIVATNNSWSGPAKSTALLEAIRAHQNLGILFVAAAGNNSLDLDSIKSYPASYELPNIIAVAATDHRDLLASFSNYGRRSVHVGAPGVRILSTVPNQGYALFSGTSMAAPHVSGLIAIIKSRFPALDYRGIKNLVIAGGTPIASLTTKTISGRRIRGADTNGRGSLTCVNQIVNSRLTPAINTVGTIVGRPLFLSALRINCANPAGAIVLYTSSLQTIILQDNGLNGDVTAGDGIYSLLWTPTVAGNFALNFGNNDIVTVSVAAAPLTSPYRPFNVTYSYDVITGTALNAEDESVHTITSPFPIRFNNFAPGYQTLYVSSNGTISFTHAINPGHTNQPLPTNLAQTLIAPFWDDLTPTSGVSDIFYATIGTAPTRKFVVEWRNMRHFNINGAGTFQVVFFENSSDVRFNYLDTNFGSVLYNSGANATVGIQNALNTARQLGFNQSVVPSNFSVLFRI